MRDSLLRVIDDLETKKQRVWTVTDDEDVAESFIDTVDYVVNELRKVLDDHPNANG